MEYLLTSLPEVDFHVVAAPTNVSDFLKSFSRFSNFQLYECANQRSFRSHLELADVYLDINNWSEVDNIVERALAIGKPIFAFDTVVHRTAEGVQVFSLEDKENMVAAIRHR